MRDEFTSAELFNPFKGSRTVYSSESAKNVLVSGIMVE